jgi:hypothetical protein
MLERHQAELIRQQREREQARHAYNALQHLAFAKQSLNRLPLDEYTVNAGQLIAQAHGLLCLSAQMLGVDVDPSVMPEPFDVACEMVEGKPSA